MAEERLAAQERSLLEEFFLREDELVTTDGLGEEHVAEASQRHRELLGFRIGEEEYGLGILEIQEIIRVPEITSVPRAPRVVMGIISLRGTIVPVVDLRLGLKLTAAQIQRSSRILVLRGGGEPLGLLVDAVQAVVRIPMEGVEAMPQAMQRDASDLVEGVGRTRGRLVIILSARAVENLLGVEI